MADEVSGLLDDVVRLSAKLSNREFKRPEEVPTLPTELSYWIASRLYGVASEQQSLLELQDTASRLRREAEILGTTRSHLAARTALKDVLKDEA